MSQDKGNKYWSSGEPLGGAQPRDDTGPGFDTGAIQKELDLLLEERRKWREQQLVEELERREGRAEPLERAEAEEPLPPIEREGQQPAAREGAAGKTANRADIKAVRAFVQTSFDASFEEAEEPLEKRFVVQLPEEVYQIGRPAQAQSEPGDSEPPQADAAAAMSYEEFEAQYESFDEAPDLDRPTFHARYEESLGESRPEKRGLLSRWRDRIRALGEDDGDESEESDDEVDAQIDEDRPETPDDGQVTLAELTTGPERQSAASGQTVIMRLPLKQEPGPAADFDEADAAATRMIDPPVSPELPQEEGEEEEYDEALERRVSLSGLFTKGAQKKRPDGEAQKLDKLPAAELSALLTRRAKSIDARSKPVVLLAVLQLAPLLWQVGPLGVPAISHGLLAILSAALLGLQLALGHDVFTAAADELRTLRPGFGCMVSLAGVLALLQALQSGRMGAAVLTAYPALLHSRWLLNRRAVLRKARIDSKLVCSDSVKRVPCLAEWDLEEAEGAPAKTTLFGTRRSGLTGYFGRSLAPGAAELLAPLYLACTLVATVLFAGLNRASSQPLPLLSLALIALCCMLPLGVLICCDRPFSGISDQLRRRGATLAGHPGMRELSRADEVLLTDQELFATRTPVIAGVKLYNRYTIEDAVLTTASLARFLELPLQRALLAMIDNRDDRLMSMTEVRHLEGAGVQAHINGNVAVLGTEAFLRHETVSIRKDEIAIQIEQSERVPLYLAIGGHLAAVFSIEYDVPDQTAELCTKLAESGIGLLVATMDPLLTGKLVELVAGLPRGSVRTISQRRRKQLEEQADREQPVKAAANSSSPLVLMRLILGAVSVRRASLLGQLASLAAMAAGTFLSAALIRAGSFEVADLTVLLLFQLAWLLPVWCAGFIAAKKVR